MKSRLCSLTAACAALLTAPLVWAGDPDTQYANHSIETSWSGYADSLYSTSTSAPQWWRMFDDPVLDTLVQRAVADNYNVRTAARRIDIARAAVGQARAAYYPQLGVSAGYTYARSSGAIVHPTVPASSASYFNAGAQMSWEIDVFGKITRQVRGAESQVRLTRAESAGVELSVVAQVVSTYIELRVEQAQLDLARQHSASQLKVLNIAKARFETGLASMMDVDQANQVYYSTIAQIPLLEKMIHGNITALSVMLGQPYNALDSMLGTPTPIPNYLQMVEAGVPADLLRRRPDVVQAEQQISVAAAQLGIARSQWLPSLTLQGSLGTQAHRAADLGKKDAFVYSVAPTLSWTVFDGMARAKGVESARLSMQNAVDNYNYTVLNAVQETDNALATYFSYLKYIKSLENVVEASQLYDRRAVDNYKSGLSPFINVADAQMSYLSNMNQLIVAKGNAIQSLINLYKALGGGWEGL